MARLIPALLLPLCAACEGGFGLEKIGACGGGAVAVIPESDIGFGTVSPYGQSVRRELLVQSSSTGTIVLQSLVITGGGGSFQLESDPAPTPIEPGLQERIGLVFKPTAADAFAALLSVNLDVGEPCAVKRNLEGEGCGDENRDGRCDAARAAPPDPGDTGDAR